MQTSEARCVWIDCQSNARVFIPSRFWSLSLKQFPETNWFRHTIRSHSDIIVSIPENRWMFGCCIIIAAAAFGQDMATQLFFWDAFKAACRKAGVKRGKFMNPRVAEWLVGALLANCLPHKFYCALKSVNVCPIGIRPKPFRTATRVDRPVTRVGQRSWVQSALSATQCCQLSDSSEESL